MKLIHAILVSTALCAAVPLASAQSGPINVYFGLGTATDSSSNRSIDTFGTGSAFTSPKLGGLFGDVGANIMLTPRFGFGGDLSWRTTSAAYAGLNYRPFFYNFDGIYTPAKSRHVEPELRLGLGGVSLRYSYTQQFCDQFTGCTTSNQYLESSHHFQVHGAVAARLYATKNLFVRPAFDVHYVNNFFQFGRNWVPEYSLGIGWSFARGE